MSNHLPRPSIPFARGLAFRAARRRGRVRLAVAVPLGLLAASALGFVALRGGSEDSGAKTSASHSAGPGRLRWTVQRVDLTLSALSQGELKTRTTTAIANEVERQVKLRWIIDEGAYVRAGDKLVELDSTDLNEALLKQRIRMAEVEESVKRSEAGLTIAENKARTDLVAAENALKVAQLDLKKYEEGDYLQAKRKGESAVILAEEEIKRANNRLEWTRRLVEKGYETQSTLEADEFAVKNGTIKLESARDDLALLERYAFERERTKLQTGLVEARGRLEQTRLAGQRDVDSQAAALSAARSTYELESLQLKNLESEVARCVIKAPQDGMVVYYKDRWRGNENTFQVGTVVSSRQRLLELPDFSAWRVEARVHESLIQRIKNGQKAFVTLDALPDRLLEGVVSRISVLPDNSNWMRTTQEYLVDIFIDAKEAGFKPGMSAKAEIVMGTLEDVLAIPIQAVGSDKGEAYVWVAGEGGPAKRKVVPGRNNDRFVEIAEGLTEGEVILMDRAPSSSEGSGLGTRPADKASAEQRADANTAAEGASVRARQEGEARMRGPAAPAGPASAPSGEAKGDASAGEQKPAAGADPAPPGDEQKAANRRRMREYLDTLTPEQREDLRKRAEQGGAGESEPRAETPSQ